MSATLTLEIPDALYERLMQMARATECPLEEIIQRVLEVGSPPSWADAPEPFQAELAILDELDNEALWDIAYSQLPNHVSEQMQELVEPLGQSAQSGSQAQLEQLQLESDCFMLRKAQAAAILRWRGCHVPLP